MELKNGRNSEIELFRFLFAVGVMLGHFSILHKLPYFRQGGIGVEYFFLLTGLLMAKSAERAHEVEASCIGTQCWNLIKRKISVFYLYYVIVMVIQTTVRVLFRDWGVKATVKHILNGIPHFLLAEVTGAHVQTSIALSGRWYLSAMILAIAVLYPILLRYSDYAKKVLFPLVALLGLGYLQGNYGGITGNYKWMGIVELGLIRGIAEIALGVVCYNIASRITVLNLTNFAKFILGVIKVSAYVLIVLYIIGFIHLESLIACALMAIGLILSYSKIGSFLPDGNKVCVFLGKLSLPLYLIHVPTNELLGEILGAERVGTSIPWLVVASVFAAVLLMCFAGLLKKLARKYRHFLVRSC